jgi:hypothetical protein
VYTDWYVVPQIFKNEVCNSGKNDRSNGRITNFTHNRSYTLSTLEDSEHKVIKVISDSSDTQCRLVHYFSAGPPVQ